MPNGIDLCILLTIQLKIWMNNVLLHFILLFFIINIFFIREIISNYKFCFFHILIFNTIYIIHTLLVI